MGPYTVLQLVEVAIFTTVAVYGILGRHPSVALIGIGLLVGKAIMNILSRRLSVTSRSLVGYGLGLGLAGISVLVVRNLAL